MKKILALVLAILMVLPALVACNSNGDSGTVTTETPTTTELPDNTTVEEPGDTSAPDVSETTPPETTVPEEPAKLPESSVQLVKDKNATFSLVYKYNDPDTKGLVEELFIELLKAKVKNCDNIYDDSKVAPDENTIEILIGNTNRPETAEVKKFIGYNDYGIVPYGNKLVICAHSTEAVKDAVAYFIENYVTGKDLSNFVMNSENQYISSRYYPNKKNASIFGGAYNDYTIVIPKDHTYTELRFAQRLQTMIGQKVGAVMPIVTDDASATEREILVGKTSRTAGSVAAHEYLIKANGKKLELISDSFYGYDYLYDFCNTDMIIEVRAAKEGTDDIARNSYVNDLNADRNTHYTAKEGDIRIAYHNVCGFGIGSAPLGSNMPELRNPMIAEYYANYGVDILCLEEITPSMRVEGKNVADFMAKYGYAECASEKMSFKVPANCDYAVGNPYNLMTTTPILYNKNTLKCLESGAKNYCQELSASTGIYFQWDKCMSYAVFEHIKTGEKFVVINVHFDSFENNAGDGMPPRKAKAETEFIIKIANELAAKYGCHAIVGGDMNVTINDPMFTTNKQFINAGYSDVQKIAKVAENERGHFQKSPQYNECIGGGFFTGEGQVGFGNYEGSVDHIYVSPQGNNKIIFHFFDVLNDSAANSFGDHCGMLVDFSFNK